MLQKLENYYRTNGIISTSFKCEHKDKCATGCDNFTGPKSAFVSTGYERGDTPRLLFISLDSGSGEKNDENRLPSAVRKQNEVERKIDTLAKHKHWYRTHELAWYILRCFNPQLELSDVNQFFAHTNSAKCCMNNPQRKKANAILFRNCKGFLDGELNILSPTIIVSQGKEAKEAVMSLLPAVIHRFDEFASEVELSSRKIFWLHTYHPNNWGAFNKQRNFDKAKNSAEGWVKYSELILNFVERS